MYLLLLLSVATWLFDITLPLFMMAEGKKEREEEGEKCMKKMLAKKLAQLMTTSMQVFRLSTLRIQILIPDCAVPFKELDMAYSGDITNSQCIVL